MVRKLRDMLKEVGTKGYFERARARARRRRSPWNLLLVPLVLGGGGIIGYSLFHMMWRVHLLFYPQHTGRLGEFWKAGISFNAFVSSFLLCIPLLFAALPLVMMFANCVIWCIGPARKVLEREAQGVKGTSFRDAMFGLAVIAMVIVPVCLLLSFIGAVTLRSLR